MYKTILSKSTGKIKFYFVLSAIIVSFLASCSGSEKIQLITPVNGDILFNNIPTFTWKSKQSFSQYEIWIDHIRMDAIDGGTNLYVTFPLSFGKHTWQIIGINEGSLVKSRTETFFIEDKPLSNLPANAIILRDGWSMISSEQISDNGSKVSSSEINTSQWANTSIPATVLSALVRNGFYPNPYTGLNNMKIPDCSDEFNQKYGLLKYSHIEGKNPWAKPYWFRKAFFFAGNPDQKAWLNFGEINYKAQVWLNGHLIADTTLMKGMEREFRFDVSGFLVPNDSNYLAVAIFPPDHPGVPEAAPLEPLADPGTNMADGLISKDYTKWDAIGWDWQPAVRDRDMGITEDVYFSFTDDIEIGNLYITSDLPLPDTSYADVTISADIINYSDTFKEGEITGIIYSGSDSVRFTLKFSVKPKEKTSIYLDKTNTQVLHILQPKLWWPAGYGKPDLYRLKLTAKTNSGDESTVQSNFGIREVETFLSQAERVYKLNGITIYPKGGNWVIDMMLNWSAQRYIHEILLTKNANMNMLRIWGPTGAPPEVFFDAADQYGIMLWQDFLNDFWGTFKNKPGYLPDQKLFEQATTAMVKKYRNHPSLVIWCGGNEGPNPREELIMKTILPQYDGRDSKHYLKISNGDGLHGGGPYHTLIPEEYFTHDRLNGFSSEIGPSGVPVFESMNKFLTLPGENYLPDRFPIDGEWAYHDATDRNDTRKFSSYDNIVRDLYGRPEKRDLTGVKEYIDICQLVNYDSYRASIESINRLLWDKASGILLWKSNSSWPSIVWQVYDWYMQANAGYYAVKKASEMVHVQLNRDSMDVILLNLFSNALNPVSVKAVLYDENLNIIWNEEGKFNLQANGVTKTNWVVPSGNQLAFLKLTAADEKGATISDNFYWLSNRNDFTGLKDLLPARLNASVYKTDMDESVRFSVTITNSGKGMAFMTALYLNGKDSGTEILPSYWSDNYITLLPGESKNVVAEVNKSDLNETPVIECIPFNGGKISVKTGE